MYRLTDIYKKYWNEFVKHPQMYIEPRMFKAVNQTLACRTIKLGKHIYRCPECEEEKVVHNSCKNRFCPRCGYVETQEWSERLLNILAPMRHHHVVFTLPEEILVLVQRYPKVVYNTLFKAATGVLKDWFEHKHNLTPGIVAVLHTAGFALKRHIHLHVLVTGGGIRTRDGRWHELEHNYLTRLDFFRNRFRWQFEHDLLLAQKRGEMDDVKEHALKVFFKEINHHRWVVAVQKGLNRPERVVRYIGRYIKRPPLSEHAIQSMDDGTIRFLSKNSRTGKQSVALSANDFLRRFLMHVPLESFHSVRSYGIYNGHRNCPPLVPKEWIPTRRSRLSGWREIQIAKTGDDPLRCPSCLCEMVYCGMNFHEYAKTG
jgi:hypothetical protein